MLKPAISNSFSSPLKYIPQVSGCQLSTLSYITVYSIPSNNVNFQFTLHSFIVSDIMNFNNLVRRQFGESILDFDNILNVTLET